MVQCAQREVMEETGIRIRTDGGYMSDGEGIGRDRPAGGGEAVHASNTASEGPVGSAAGGKVASSAWSTTLSHPTAFAAADSIHVDPLAEGGRVKWHYCIVEVLPQLETLSASLTLQTPGRAAVLKVKKMPVLNSHLSE